MALHPIITVEQFDQAKAGDIAVRNEIIEANKGLIAKVAKRVASRDGRNFHHAFEDRFQDGVVAMIRAIEMFDTSRGLQFSTYAFRWLHGYMDRRQRLDRMIRIPIKDGLSSDSHRARDASTKVLSFDIDDCPLMDSHCFDSFEGETLLERRIRAMRDSIDHLPQRDREIMSRRMNGDTLEEIAPFFGVTKQRIQQIEQRCMKHIWPDIRRA